MIKPGDLVMLADESWVVPGALTALKYFQRLRTEYGGKTMIVLEVSDKPIPQYTHKDQIAGLDKNVIVMVDGRKQIFTSSLLRVVDEAG
jgi:hypothetical protein